MTSNHFAMPPLLDRTNSMNTHKALSLNGAPYANTVLRIASYGLLVALVASQWVHVVGAITAALVTLLVHIGLWVGSISATQLTVTTVTSVALSVSVVIATLLAPSQWFKGVDHFAPVFLQWSSRWFIDLALLISATAAYLACAQMILGGSVWANSINFAHAALLTVLAFAALRASIQQDLATYQAHALRIFVVVSGMWVTPAISAGELGTALSWLSLASDVAQGMAGLIFSLLGLGLYELYQVTQRSNAPANQMILSLSMVLLAALLLTFFL